MNKFMQRMLTMALALMLVLSVAITTVEAIPASGNSTNDGVFSINTDTDHTTNGLVTVDSSKEKLVIINELLAVLNEMGGLFWLAVIGIVGFWTCIAIAIVCAMGKRLARAKETVAVWRYRGRTACNPDPRVYILLSTDDEGDDHGATTNPANDNNGK